MTPTQPTERVARASNRLGALRVQLTRHELDHGDQCAARHIFERTRLTREVRDAECELACAEHEQERNVHIDGTAALNKY